MAVCDSAQAGSEKVVGQAVQAGFERIVEPGVEEGLVEGTEQGIGQAVDDCKEAPEKGLEKTFSRAAVSIAAFDARFQTCILPTPVHSSQAGRRRSSRSSRIWKDHCPWLLL